MSTHSNIIVFDEFEKAVITKIIEKPTASNLILREQYKQAQIIDREFTGVGFFTHFKLPENINRITEPVEYGYGNVVAVINGLDEFGFVLFIKNGKMVCLEGYTWGEVWPEKIMSYSLCKTKHE